MKAVILAAGNGTRLYPLTLTRPKFLMPLANQPLADYFINMLKGICDEVILVINESELNKQIIEYLESLDVNIKFHFVYQTEQLGTGHALQMVKDFIGPDERFLCMYGDDIYSRIDVENLLKNEYGLIGKKVVDPEKWGILQCDSEGNLVQLIEKPTEFVGNLANPGLYLLDGSIFEDLSKVERSIRGEYEITDAVTMFASRKKMKAVMVEGLWLPIGYPWHILDTLPFIIENNRFEIKGESRSDLNNAKVNLPESSTIGENVEVNGYLVVGEGVVIEDGVKFEGLNVIGDGSHIGKGATLNNSVLMKNVMIGEECNINSSVIGNNAMLGNECVLNDSDNNSPTIKSMIKEKLVDTMRAKFGALLGDGVKLGNKVKLSPGIKIWPKEVVQDETEVESDIIWHNN